MLGAILKCGLLPDKRDTLMNPIFCCLLKKPHQVEFVRYVIATGGLLLRYERTLWQGWSTDKNCEAS